MDKLTKLVENYKADLLELNDTIQVIVAHGTNPRELLMRKSWLEQTIADMENITQSD